MLAPRFGLRTDVVCYAKPLAAGDQLDGPGGFACYGLIENRGEAPDPGFPICLSHQARLRRSVGRDDRIGWKASTRRRLRPRTALEARTRRRSWRAESRWRRRAGASAVGDHGARHLSSGALRARGGARGTGRISHAIFARLSRFARRFAMFSRRAGWWRQEDASGAGIFPGLRVQRRNRSRWAWDDAAVVTRCDGACQAGEPRALAAALRRTAARLDLGSRTARRHRDLDAADADAHERADLEQLGRIVPQLALANGV